MVDLISSFGSPTTTSRVLLWRQYVTAIGGNPTKYDVTGLVKEAIITLGGLSTKNTYAGALRELVATLGSTPVFVDAQYLLEQLLTMSVSNVSPDVVPPTLASALGVQSGTTTANLSVNTNEGNGILYWVITFSSVQPTAIQVKNGLDTSGAVAPAKGSGFVVATGPVTAGAIGLLPSTTYYAHFMQEDGSGNKSTVVTSPSFTTPVAADVTAPVLTGVTGTALTATTASIDLSTTDNNGVVFWVVTTSPTPPTALQVKNGQTSIGTAAPAAGSQAATAAGVQPTIAVSGLSASTLYYAHVMHEDASSNQSIVATTLSFTTSAVAPSNTVAPAVTGTPQDGAVLTTTNGSWTQSPSGFSRQWYSNTTNSVVGRTSLGATGTTYTPGSGQVGKFIFSGVVATNSAGSSSEIFSNIVGPVVASADVTAPVLSSPTGTQTGSTTATGGVSTNEGNGILYWVVTTSATPPSAVQVKAGQNNGGMAAVASGSLTINSTGAKTVNAAGLTASTGYYFYFMHEDIATNKSTVAASAQFTTASAATLSAPSLTRTTSAGTNPMRWTATYPGATLWDAATSTGTKVRMRYRKNGGAWVPELDQVLDSTNVTDGFTWPLYMADTFAGGVFVEVQEQQALFSAGVETQTSAWTTPTLSDTMAGGAPVVTGKIVFEGDSITAWGGGVADQYAAARPTFAMINRAVGGNGLNNLLTRQATVLADDPQAFYVLIGANDLASGTYADGAAYANAVMNYTDPIRAGGAKIVICVPLPQAAPAGNPTGHNPRIDLCRTTLLAAVGSRVDYVIDYRNDPVMGPNAAAADTTLYADGIHPTDGTAFGPYSGLKRLGGISIPILDQAMGYASDATPNAFSITPQTGATASAVTTSGSVTPAGYDTPVAISVNNGFEIEVNGCGKWRASDIIMPSQNFKVRGAASGTAGASVNATVTIGGVSAVYTITTAAGGGGPAADVVATSSVEQFAAMGFSGASTKTFTAVPFDAGRALLHVNTNGGRTITSVTVNGVAATAVAGMTSGDSRFYIGGSVLSAGNYDVVVTCNNAIGDLWVHTCSLQNLASTTPLGISILGFSYRANGVQTATSSITLGGGDVGMFLGRRDTGVGISAFGPTGSLLKDFGSWFFAKFTASGNPTFTDAAFSNSQIIGAGFDG